MEYFAVNIFSSKNYTYCVWTSKFGLLLGKKETVNINYQ